MTTVAALVFSSSAFAQDEPTSTPPPTSEPASPSSAPPPAQPQQQNSISGVLYADKNANWKQDPGEAVEGSEVTIDGDGGTRVFKTVTDANGAFAFAGLAPGVYYPSYALKDGWVVHHGQQVGSQDIISVDPGVTTEVTARAERPYSEQIKATASLDRGSYEYPGTAKITVSLTNTTGRAIDGVMAQCNRALADHALGREVYWQMFGAEGQTLAAGQKRTFTATEKIPPEALAAGVVTLDCDFAPNGHWNSDGPAVHVEAKVIGEVSYTMVLGEDRNADQRIDADEVVSGEKVVLLNQQTGRWVAERTSDADGKVEFTGLADGDYQAVLPGPWTFTDDSQQLVRVAGQGSGGTGFLKRAGPAHFSATMKLDKPRYESQESVRLDVTIKNDGDRTAERVRLIGEFGFLKIAAGQWGDVAEEGPGARIPAGESRTYSVSAKISYFLDGRLRVSAFVDYAGRPASETTSVAAEAEVVQTYGGISGVVYADKNHNGQQDPGEAAADAVVEANGGIPFGYSRTTTDAEGRYAFKDVPTGDYTLGYTLAGGWIVHAEPGRQEVSVRPGEQLQLSARGERPYSESFKALVALDKPTYEVGDDATITVTLTNKTARPVDGIQAACAKDVSTWPVSSSWGDLHGAGVSLGPGDTKTFTVREKVPESVHTTNRVTVQCDFAPLVLFNSDVVTAYDWAAVPGGVGSTTGTLAHDANRNQFVDAGEAIPNTRVLLMTEPEYGGIVAEATSDAQGKLTFVEVPPGRYWAQPDGPWAMEVGLDTVEIIAGLETSYHFFVVPAPLSTPPGGDDGGTDGWGTEGALAKTGASVLGLGAVAVLLVAFGIGARVAGRRRTS